MTAAALMSLASTTVYIIGPAKKILIITLLWMANIRGFGLQEGVWRSLGQNWVRAVVLTFSAFATPVHTVLSSAF